MGSEVTVTSSDGIPFPVSWIHLHCDQCGQSFARNPSRVKERGPFFCSRDCGFAWRRDHAKRDMTIEPHRYRVNPETGCWDWLGAKVSGGYGSLGFDGKTITAHIVSYVQYCGPVPDGMELDHTCRNRGCVNPNHLEPVTRRVNVIRGKTLKLTPELVRELRRRGNESSRALGHEFGLSKTTVTDVVKRRKWAEIPD